jgi:myo-inositol-1(or 4)-monophosphatase
MFFAEKRMGAFMLDSRGAEKRLRIPPMTDFSKAMIATGMPWNGKPGHAKFLKELHKVMAKSAGVRRFGSAALDLAWTAAGRFNGFWERGLLPWDIAAGIVIVREAGGLVQELDTGNQTMLESGNIVCANEALLKQLLECIED